MSEELKAGKEIYLKLPYGELFTKKHSKEKTVFIAGGTGITPFLSLFNSGHFKNYASPLLYLGVKDQGYNIYNDELEIAKKMNPDFFINIVHENTQGILNIEKIYELNGSDSTYFISGPPGMIKNFKIFCWRIK